MLRAGEKVPILTSKAKLLRRAGNLTKGSNYGSNRRTRSFRVRAARLSAMPPVAKSIGQGIRRIWNCRGTDDDHRCRRPQRLGRGHPVSRRDVLHPGHVHADGGTAQPVVEDKQWAGGDAGADAITCTMHVDDTSPDGHFVADFRVTAVPV